MKTLYNILLLCFSFGCITTTVAQESPKILKVSYTTHNVSDFLIQMLKSQIKDPQEYAKIMGKASEYILYHTLYQNIATQESVYVLDSIHEVPGISTTGHCSYVYTDSTKERYGSELFMGKEVNFKAKQEVLEWNITNESTAINGLPCIKATLQSNPEIYVWFTLEIPVATGPYVYTNLPGLVVESNSFFQSTTAVQVAYEKETSAFENAVEKVKATIASERFVAFEKVLVKKQNFRRMAERGQP